MRVLVTVRRPAQAVTEASGLANVTTALHDILYRKHFDEFHVVDGSVVFRQSEAEIEFCCAWTGTISVNRMCRDQLQ